MYICITMKDIFLLIVFVFGCLTVGAVSGIATTDGLKEWYPALIKPSFNPPNWIFGPVWSLLYGMMGVSLFLVWKKVGFSLVPFSVFFIQITLNFFWSFLFFKFHLLGWSLVEIVVLWGFILLTIIVFYKISHVAAYLLVPYLLWVSFATLLNASFFRLNG